MIGRRKAPVVDLTTDELQHPIPLPDFRTTNNDNSIATQQNPIPTVTLDDSVDITNRGLNPPELIDITDSDSESPHNHSLRSPPPKRRPGSRRPYIFSAIDKRATSTHESTTAPAPPRPQSPPENSLKCPICIEPYTSIKRNGARIIVTRCGHLFCDPCLKKAIQENGRKCPKCRKNIPKSPTALIEVFDVC